MQQIILKMAITYSPNELVSSLFIEIIAKNLQQMA